MEAVPILLLEFVCEFVLSEITQHMLSSACGFSKKKWKKIMKKINKNKVERPMAIQKRVSELPTVNQLEIMDFCANIALQLNKEKMLKHTEI